MSRKPRRNSGCSTLSSIFVIIILIVGLVQKLGSGELFQCRHNWKDATCTSPEICSKCQETSGAALGHDLPDAPCGEAAECRNCGESVILVEEHDWAEATCTTPEVCTICAAEQGSALGHDLVLNDCSVGFECTECGHLEGAKAHEYLPATCTAPEICSACGLTMGSANPHVYDFGKCGEPLICLNCDLDPAEVPAGVTSHTFAESDTGTHRTCTECGTPVEILFNRNGDGSMRVYTEYPRDGSAPYTTYFDGRAVYSAQWTEKNGKMVLDDGFGGAPYARCVNGKVYFDLYGYESSDGIEEALANTTSGYVYFTHYMWTESDESFGGDITLHTDPLGNGMFYEFEYEGRAFLMMDVDGNPYAIIYKGEDWENPDAVYAARMNITLTPSN